MSHCSIPLRRQTKDVLFRKHDGNYNQLMPEEIELLDLDKSWCLFVHCLLHKNRLALLAGVTSYVYDKSDTVTKPLLVGMRYTGDNQDAILEYLRWQKTNHIQIPSHMVHQRISVILMEELYSNQCATLSFSVHPWRIVINVNNL
jgi:hypothetical protein